MCVSASYILDILSQWMNIKLQIVVWAALSVHRLFAEQLFYFREQILISPILKDGLHFY